MWRDTISSMDLQDTLEQVRAEIAPSIGEGSVADYIPSLASVDPQQFGMAVASNDGEVHVVGDGDVSFSVQSISKVFSLALVVANDGDHIWRRVSREPSGNPFNSLHQLDQEHGKPRNPFINAGALVVTDRLHSLTGDATSCMRAFVRRESSNPDIDGDPDVARSESQQGHRNAALAHLLASYGNLECPVVDVLEQYFWQCSLSMSCRERWPGVSCPATGYGPTAPGCSPAATPSASTLSCLLAVRTTRRVSSPIEWGCQVRVEWVAAFWRLSRIAARSVCGVQR